MIFQTLMINELEGSTFYDSNTNRT